MLKKKLVSMVDANILLLLGMEYQKKWGMIIDLGKQEIYIRKSGDRFRNEKETTQTSCRNTYTVHPSHLTQTFSPELTFARNQKFLFFPLVNKTQVDFFLDF